MKELSTRQRKYREYLASDHWAKLKEGRHRKTCLGCGLHANMQLHHMFYRPSVYQTKKQDLMWICGSCHKTFHDVVGLQLPKSLTSLQPTVLRAVSRRIIQMELYRTGKWPHPSKPKALKGDKPSLILAKQFVEWKIGNL